MRLIDADTIPYSECCVWSDEEEEIIERKLSVYKSAIDNMPTIDPESLRPKRRWIYEPVEFSNKKDIRCPCGRYVNQPENYCPNCGAKMEG